MMKVIFLLLVCLAAVSAQVSLTGTPSLSPSVSTSVSWTVSVTGTVSTSVSWSISNTVSISLSGSPSPTGSPTPTATPSTIPSPSNPCGNGVIDTALGEECDNAALSGTECCNINCRFKHIGAKCHKASAVCKSKGRCFKNKSATDANREVDCILTRNNPNGSGCPIGINGTTVKGFCLNGVCKAPRRFR